ncbi:MAG: TIGR01777 family oxidoreductase [Candidatus Aminicenantales bacterium]
MMKILVTGGTGFVGRRITPRLIQDGHEVTILTRSARELREVPLGVAYLRANPTQKGPWQEAIKDHDAAINLAGASIFARWTEAYKMAIRESRLRTTRHLVEGIPAHSRRPFTLLSASAVGYYGFAGNEDLTEDSPPGDDFLAQITRDWEEEAMKAKEKGARVVIMRLGIVLGEKGGALSQMIPLFRKYIGGPLGSGQQWFSWVHIQDLCEAIVFLIKHAEISGSVNICTPNPVTNKDLAKALGKALNRPSIIPTPGFLVKWVFGEMASIILKGQKVTPKRLQESGFVFQYPEIEQALTNLLGRS